MKHKLLFRRFFASLLLLAFSTLSWAYDFVVDGIYYYKNSDGTSVTVTFKEFKYKSYYGSKVIPSTVVYYGKTYNVTRIDEYAFLDCSGLTSIKIPESVTSIGVDAFEGCTNLPVIDNMRYADTYLVEALDKTQNTYNIKSGTRFIGSSAFKDCHSLTSITIPNSVTSIGVDAFEGCTNLPVIDNIRYADTYLIEAVDKTLSTYSIKAGTRFIGTYAFRDCSKLSSVNIPNSVTSIGIDAFYGCSGLTSIAIPKSMTSIGEKAFENCSGLTSITIPNSVTDIEWAAFFGCSGLTFVTIPNSVTSIGSSAFENCSGLTSVTIGNSVTSIGSSAFENCSGLTSITIPNSVTSIGDWAFRDCTGLTSVTIPNSVTSIGAWAFINCSGLTSVTIGNSVTSIGYQAFSGCSGLTSVTIGNSVTSIGYQAFGYCSGLTSITIPNSVTSIDEAAFQYCSGLTSVTIPNSVTSIGRYAFKGCEKLSSIILGDNIKSLGQDVIKDTPKTCRFYVNKKASCTLFTLWKMNYVPRIVDTYKELPAPSISVKKTASSLLCERASSIIDDGFTNESMSITVNGTKITQSGRSIYVSGLQPSCYYDVQYDVECSGADTYTRKEEFVTNELVMNTQTPKVISVGNVIVEATSNLDDAEENVGFEWRRTDWTSDFPSNTGTAYLYEGTMEGYIRNLYAEKLWKARPYYKSNSGYYYYGDWVGIDPTNTSFFEPTVHTYAKISVEGTKAKVTGYALRGTDAISSQGFKYWVSESSAREAIFGEVSATAVPRDAKTIEAEGRVMEADLTGLDYKTTYSYVAFVTTTEGEIFYGKELSFTTGDDPMGIDNMPEAEQYRTPKGDIDDNAPIYDLMGRRLQQKPASGYYIQGKKKYFVK